jgi:hypothetical protein
MTDMQLLPYTYNPGLQQPVFKQPLISYMRLDLHISGPVDVVSAPL